jgi:hypothetical protein
MGLGLGSVVGCSVLSLLSKLSVSVLFSTCLPATASDLYSTGAAAGRAALLLVLLPEAGGLLSLHKALSRRLAEGYSPVRPAK